MGKCAGLQVCDGNDKTGSLESLHVRLRSQSARGLPATVQLDEFFMVAPFCQG